MKASSGPDRAVASAGDQSAVAGSDGDGSVDPAAGEHSAGNLVEAQLSRHWPECLDLLGLDTESLPVLIQAYGDPASVAAGPEGAAGLLCRSGRSGLGREKIPLLANARRRLGVSCLATERARLQWLATDLLKARAGAADRSGNCLPSQARTGGDAVVPAPNQPQADYELTLRNPVAQKNLGELSEAEFDVLDAVWEEFGSLGRWELRDYTHIHCPEWEDLRGSSHPVPYHRVFRVLGRSPQEARESSDRIASQEEHREARGGVSAERRAPPPGRRRAERLVRVRRVSAVGDEMPGHATRRQVIAGVLVPRGVRAGTDAGRTRAAEGNCRRPIVCTRNRTDPISGCAKNGDAPESEAQASP